MPNQFSVTPPDIYGALIAGVGGYDRGQKIVNDNELKQGRLDAVNALQSGGDIRTPLARLLQVGDVQGANAIANFAHQQATERLTGQQITEQGRHNQATERLTAQGQTIDQNKPISLPPMNTLVDRKGNTLREPTSVGSLDAPTIDAMARQYIAGDTSVLTNLGRGAQGAENVVALRKRVAEINSGAGETGPEQAARNAEMMGVKAGMRTAATRGANIEIASTEFNQLLPVVQKASLAVNRTNYPDLNKIILAGEQKIGDPNVVALGGAVNTLVNVYARAISPTGQPTVHDKLHAREILDKAWSQGQFEAATGMMKQEIDAALQSPEKVRDAMRERFLKGAGAKGAGSMVPGGGQIVGGAPQTPKIGDVISGYRYKGGNPADQTSWVPIQ